MKFHKYTDTLLYLATRNEHIQNKIRKAKRSKKILICDRFIDSTIAYQVYGKKSNLNLLKLFTNIYLKILNLTLLFCLKLKLTKHLVDLKKEKLKIGMINFQKNFTKCTKAFIKLAKK